MNGNFTIEPMRIEDFDAVTALWKSAEGVGLTESDNRVNVGHYLKRNPGLSLIARDGRGKIVGALMCGHDGRRGFLYHLAIDPAHQRRGLAKGMVDQSLAKLAAVGILKCNILVFANNKSGRTFWEHLGWDDRSDLELMQRDTERR